MADPPGWKALHDYVHPGNVKVRVTLFWTSNAASDPSQRLVAEADKLLKQHGLGLDARPGVPTQAATTVPFSDVILTANDDQVEDLRQKADAVFAGVGSSLPVIFCPFGAVQGADSCGINGITYDDLGWPVFVLINSKLQSPDGLTLLHEIGHAAKQVHIPKGDKDVVANFMSIESNRTDMLRNQVIGIANALFANGAPAGGKPGG